MTIILYRRMYDPVARKSWWQPFTIEAGTPAELKAEIAKLDARHPRWTGETPHG